MGRQQVGGNINVPMGSARKPDEPAPPARDEDEFDPERPLTSSVRLFLELDELVKDIDNTAVPNLPNLPTVLRDLSIKTIILIDPDDPSPDLLHAGRILARLSRMSSEPDESGDEVLPMVRDKLHQAYDLIERWAAVTINPTPANEVPSDVPVTFAFTKAGVAALRNLAQQKGRSVGETVRDALALETWIEETKRSGGHVLVERKGRLQELVSV